MFTYKLELKEQNKSGWETTEDWIRPFFDSETLDESLDSGNFKLSMIPRAEPYAPFTRLRISVFQDGVLVDTIHRLIANSVVTQKRYFDVPLYDHEIETVELTKLLEREVCDTMTVTNYLGHEYPSETDIVNPTKKDSIGSQLSDHSIILQNYYSPVIKGTEYTIYNTRTLIQITSGPLWTGAQIIKITSPSGAVIYNQEPPSTTDKVFFSEDGTYKIEHLLHAYYQAPGTSAHYYATFTWNIGVISNIPAVKDWTITDVVNRLLYAGVTRREGEPQKYVFDGTQAEKYSKVMSPEFFFTRSTLFEALLTVGGYIHAIPRLTDKDGVLTVVFDKLGGDDTVDREMPPYMFHEQTMNIDEYCGALDSPVENMLNTNDRTQGSISEPDTATYKTVRCEEAKIDISPDTMVILTEMPIYQVVKLECGFTTDANKPVGDITPYVYEAAEYSTLSSYWGTAYPYSKGYALRYTQGDNKINGLNFSIRGKTDTKTAWEDYSIINILKAKGMAPTGKEYLKNLAFRVTYIPIVNSRIVQKKAYLTHPSDNVLIYNQGGNTVESEFFGEKMKGTIARLGNGVRTRTYQFYKYEQIPKCGQVLDDMYVARVEKQYDRQCIKATLTTTPSFNKLAEYIGVNSNFRLYDISEKQSVDRYVNYGETILIGHNQKTEKGSPMITRDGVLKYGGVLIGCQPPDTHSVATTAVSAALIQGYTGRIADGTSQPIEHAIGRSCVSFASGNSLCFALKFMDNYGAGYQATYTTDDKRVQRLVRYSDALGNLSSISMKLGNGFWTPTVNSQANDNGEANRYPELPTGELKTTYIDTADRKLIISKDSREAINVMYQLHHQCETPSIVIGPALTQNNPLVTEMDLAHKGVIYFLPKRLNMLDGVVDTSGLTASATNILGHVELWVSKREMSIVRIVNDSGKAAKAWALVDPVNNKLYIGENVDLQPDEEAPKIYFSFMGNNVL